MLLRSVFFIHKSQKSPNPWIPLAPSPSSLSRITIVTIEFYWAPFLLESNSDNATVHRLSDRIVRKNSINKHGRHWRGADIVVFNTYLWRRTGFKMKILEGSFKDEKKRIVEMESEDAYRMALKTMVKWVKKNMDPLKTRVFFATISPTHYMGEDWGGEQGKNCYNQTTPIQDIDHWPSDCIKTLMKVIGEEEMINEIISMKVINKSAKQCP